MNSPRLRDSHSASHYISQTGSRVGEILPDPLPRATTETSGVGRGLCVGGRLLSQQGRLLRQREGLTEAAAGAGDLDRARALAEQTEAAARAITTRTSRRGRWPTLQGRLHQIKPGHYPRTHLPSVTGRHTDPGLEGQSVHVASTMTRRVEPPGRWGDLVKSPIPNCSTSRG